MSSQIFLQCHQNLWILLLFYSLATTPTTTTTQATTTTPTCGKFWLLKSFFVLSIGKTSCSNLDGLRSDRWSKCTSKWRSICTGHRFGWLHRWVLWSGHRFIKVYIFSSYLIGYVGTGVYTTCGAENFQPVRVTAYNGNTKLAGGYTTCGGKQFTQTSTRYLKSSARLAWVSAANTNVATKPNTYVHTNGAYQYFIVRITVSAKAYLGRVYKSTPPSGIAAGVAVYLDGANTEKTSKFYDVLTCT